jgi:hypothetical protein
MRFIACPTTLPNSARVERDLRHSVFELWLQDA